MNLKENVELKDTIELMASADYKQRFKAEYFQLEIRVRKLHEMIEKYKAGTLGFEPTCPVEMLERQLNHMQEYLMVLEERSFEEGIDLFMIDLNNRTVLSDLS